MRLKYAHPRSTIDTNTMYIINICIITPILSIICQQHLSIHFKKRRKKNYNLYLYNYCIIAAEKRSKKDIRIWYDEHVSILVQKEAIFYFRRKDFSKLFAESLDKTYTSCFIDISDDDTMMLRLLIISHDCVGIAQGSTHCLTGDKRFVCC